MLTEVGKLIININEIFEDKLIAPAFTDAGPRPFMDVQSASNLIDSAPSTKNKMYVDFPSKYYNETTGILDPQAAQASAAQAAQALNKTEIALINQQLNGKKTRPLKKQNMGPDQENLYPIYDLRTTLQMIERGPYGSAFAQHIAAKFLLQPIGKVIISRTGAAIAATTTGDNATPDNTDSKEYIQRGPQRKIQWISNRI